MWIFELILLSTASFFYKVKAENAPGVVHLRVHRSPYSMPNDPEPVSHTDYAHMTGTSYSKSYNDSNVGIFSQRADGSIKDQGYHDKKSSFDQQILSKKLGTVQYGGPNGKTVHYNNQLSDKASQNESSKTGHKTILEQPVLQTGPNGEVIVTKAKAALQEHYNHSAGESSKKVIQKKAGSVVSRKDGQVVSKQESEQVVANNTQKDFKHAQGQRMVQDEGGNFRNDTYNQLTGNESGTHKERILGNKDYKKAFDYGNSRNNIYYQALAPKRSGALNDPRMGGNNMIKVPLS